MAYVNLLLIADDGLAPAVLAAWHALGLRLDSHDAVAQIADLLGKPEVVVEATLKRCKAAAVLSNGGITEEGQQWAETVLARKLAFKK